MSEEDRFFIYLLEHYAAYAGKSADEVLARWDELGLTGFFHDMYDRYHAEALENAFADIEEQTHRASLR